MNLSNLIASRETVLAQARLANMAFAYATLKRISAVVNRTGLTHLVRLQQPNEHEERYCASLQALTGSQAVLDEHFSDDDVLALADAIAVCTPGVGLDATVMLQALEAQYVVPLELALQRAGVNLDSSGLEVQRRGE